MNPLAGVAHAIEFKTADALQRLPPLAAGTLILNPPYGERIEAKGQGTLASATAGASREGYEGVSSTANFYTRLASHWTQNWVGWTAWILSPEPKLPSPLRLKERRPPDGGIRGAKCGAKVGCTTPNWPPGSLRPLSNHWRCS